MCISTVVTQPGIFIEGPQPEHPLVRETVLTSGFLKGFICLWICIHGCCLFYLLIVVLIYVDITRNFCCRASKRCNKQKSHDSFNFPFRCCCSFPRKLVFSALLDLMPIESLPVVLERVNLMIHIIPSLSRVSQSFQ